MDILRQTPIRIPGPSRVVYKLIDDEPQAKNYFAHWYAANRGSVLARWRDYFAQNRDEINRKRRERYAKNPESFKKKAKKLYKKKDYRDKARARAKAYYANNREKVLEKRRERKDEINARRRELYRLRK
jgi:hypothetical protein